MELSDEFSKKFKLTDNNTNPKSLEILKRLLYLCDTECRYVSGNPETHSLKLIENNLEQQFEESHKSIAKLLLEANKDVLLTRRTSLHYTLAQCINISRNLKKPHLTELFSELTAIICSKNNEEIFNFIKWYSKIEPTKNKIKTCIASTIRKFFEYQFLHRSHELLTNKSFHGWSYKDLIKLSHFTSKSPNHRAMILYILFGLKESDEIQKLNPKLLEQALLLKELQQTEDVSKACDLINKLDVDICHVNQKLHRNQEVWVAILSKWDARQVFKSLPKLQKLVLLKANSPVLQKVIETLDNPKNVEACNLSPIEALAYSKALERGAQAIDPHLQQYLVSKQEAAGAAAEIAQAKPTGMFKSVPLTRAMTNAMNHSYRNIDNLRGILKSKLIMMTLDASSNVDLPCFQNRKITCLEAAMSVMTLLSKGSDNSKSYVFHNIDVADCDIINKSVPFINKVELMKEYGKKLATKYVLPTAPIKFALNKKIAVDLFINFVHTPHIFKSIPDELKGKSMKHILSKYRTENNQPNAKLVTICFGCHNFPIYNIEGSLLICGFTPQVIDIIISFCSGKFS